MALWTPSQITTALWLDASDAATLFDATTGGSTPSTGGAIARWEDKSGNANNASQATAGDRPTYLATGLNNLPTISFSPDSTTSATGDRLTIQSASVLMPSAYTILGVVADDATAGTGPSGFRAWIEKAASNQFLNRKYWLGTFGSAYGLDKSGDVGEQETILNTGVVNKSPQIVAAVKPATSANGSALFFQDGTQRSSDTSFTTLTTNTSPINIGGSFYPWNGRVSEVIILPTSSTGSRQMIEGYAAWKWGIQGSLPNDHPYKNGPPVIGGSAAVHFYTFGY